MLGGTSNGGQPEGKDGPGPDEQGDKGKEGDHKKLHYGDMNLQIIEKKHGGYDCPEIVIPPHAEERLARPWKEGLIVNLLGRRIGFKALENRLNQMWVQKGVMSIIDLGCEFFLVYLTSQEDYNRALTNGPWLIYDHYLIIREWRPNFRPEKEEVERVAVWVRLPELPIEYYDPDFLFFLGNRIGRTVKVDKTTQQMEKGKYARVCVEIDLNKSLLAHFEIKGHIYKIEYEGLHLLCMTCGKFGHHRDQCPNRVEAEVNETDAATVRQAERNGNISQTMPETGPWTVVQKQRFPRKPRYKPAPVVGGGKILSATVTGTTQLGGNRYDILGNNEKNLERINEESEFQAEREINQIITNNVEIPKNQGFNYSLLNGKNKHHESNLEGKEKTNRSSGSKSETSKATTPFIKIVASHVTNNSGILSKVNDKSQEVQLTKPKGPITTLLYSLTQTKMMDQERKCKWTLQARPIIMGRLCFTILDHLILMRRIIPTPPLSQTEEWILILWILKNSWMRMIKELQQ